MILLMLLYSLYLFVNQRDDVDVAIVVVVNAVLPKLICDFVDADNVVVNDVVVS